MQRFTLWQTQRESRIALYWPRSCSAFSHFDYLKSRLKRRPLWKLKRSLLNQKIKTSKPEIHGLYKSPLKSRNYSLLMQYSFLRSFRFGFEFSGLHTQRRGLTELGWWWYSFWGDIRHTQPNTPVLAPGYGGDKIRGSRTINNKVDTDQTIYP